MPHRWLAYLTAVILVHAIVLPIVLWIPAVWMVQGDGGVAPICSTIEEP